MCFHCGGGNSIRGGCVGSAGGAEAHQWWEGLGSGDLHHRECWGPLETEVREDSSAGMRAIWGFSVHNQRTVQPSL